MRNRLEHLLWLAALVFMTCSVAHARGAAFHSVDLSAAYAQSTAETGIGIPGLPMGSNQFHGVPFQVTGRIEITGMDAARHGAFAPPELVNIPINRKGTRLHLLHGALHGQREGIPLANVRLLFKNGETRIVRLAFGVHARNCLDELDSTKATLLDPNSRIAWEDGTKGRFIRLFQTSIDVPLPEHEIVSLDYISLFSRATPVLFAVTLQQDNTATPLPALPMNRITQRATEFPDSAYRRELSVAVTDATSGSLLSNATAVLTIGDDAQRLFFGNFKANHEGRFTIVIPPQETASLNLRVNHRGFAAEAFTWSALDGKALPQNLEVKMHRGASIGGIVVTPAGQPISNAVVIPYEFIQQSSNEVARHDLDRVTTDGQGRWQASVQTQLLARLNIEAIHADFHPAQIKPESSELLSQSVRTSMKAHAQLAGRVLNRSGAPVVRASVTLVEDSDSRVTRMTDSDGRFRFIVPGATDNLVSLVVMAPGHAPAFQTVNANNSKPLEFKLDTGNRFSMRLTDARQKPVPDVNVTLYRWENRLSLLTLTMKTDSSGRFVWDNAPDGQVTFRFEKKGHPLHYHSVTLPIKEETTFIYAAPTRIAGRVLDATTKKPVDQIRVRAEYSRPGSSSSTSTSGRRGLFSMTLSGQNAVEYTNFSLTIDANGYETLVTTIPPGVGSVTNDYELKKAKMLEGIVRAPNGSPAPGTEVVLLPETRSAYMDEPGKFRSSSYYEIALANDKGQFELTPKTNVDFVLAAHPELGYAQVAVADFRKSGSIALKPYGRVKGVLRVGDKVEPDHYAAIHSHYIPDSDAGQRRVAPLYLYYRMRPAADGQFVFEAVPPGDRMVQLRYMSDEQETGYRLSHNEPLTVVEGQTHEVTIGGKGRTVKGKVRTTGVTGLTIDGKRGRFNLILRPGPMPSEIPPPLIIPPNTSAQERQRLMRAHREKVVEASRNRTRAARFLQKSYLVLFDEENNFTVPNVPAGTYSLELSPYDPRLPRSSVRTLANVNREVVVPEGTSPFDVGTVDVPVRN